MPLLQLDSLRGRTTKGDILQFLCATGGIQSNKVGKIDLRGSSAVVEVPAEWIARLVKSLDGASLKDRRVRVWSTGERPASSGTEDHFQRLARLLVMESEAEAKRILEEMRRATPAEAEKAGNCLVGLTIIDEDSGLGGRCLLTFARRNRAQPLPWNRLEPGTPVLLSPEGGTEGWRGVVCDRAEKSLSVALQDPPTEEERQAVYRLDVSHDESSRQRQLACLERVRTANRDRLSELRDVLLGTRSPNFEREKTPFEALDSSLNAAQIEAIRFALTAQDVAIVHGPPGTGKTTAVVELIRQAVRRGNKVLACAPSNLAVDNLLERLLVHGESAIRLGHPARVLPALREHTLDLLVHDHPDKRQSRKLAKEAFALFRKAGKFTRARPEPGSRQQMRQEARALLADSRKLEDQAIERVLQGATILCATLTGLDSEVLGQRQFDLAVIDEASQSTEPACWLPLVRCHRLVLAGDHCQLPPTIISQDAARQGFGISLMERLVELYGTQITRRLDVQYRMHESIMNFSSQQFYDGQLQAHESVAGHVLAGLPGVVASPLTETPVQFIDTAGAGYDEESEADGASRFNPREAELIVRKVRALLEAGVSSEAMAVIAPYAAQVRLLREKLAVPGLEIGSVDGFQGREKEAVLLTMVRSNQEGDVGFLADERRMNVAMTRARRKLLVVGDSATLSCHPFYQSLLEYFEEIGAHGSVWEEEAQ